MNRLSFCCYSYCNVTFYSHAGRAFFMGFWGIFGVWWVLMGSDRFGLIFMFSLRYFLGLVSFSMFGGGVSWVLMDFCVYLWILVCFGVILVCFGGSLLFFCFDTFYWCFRYFLILLYLFVNLLMLFAFFFYFFILCYNCL